MLDLYRRHSKDCKFATMGQNYTKCSCPIWAYGELNGHEIRRSVKTRDWGRALRRIDKWEKHPESIAPAVTVEDATALYLKDCHARHLADSTVESYKKTLDHLNDFCRDVYGAVAIDQMDVPLLTAFRASRQVKSSTAGKELETLRAFCAFVKRQGWLPENPAKEIKPPKEDGCPTLPFTEEEVEKILAACDRLEDDCTPKRERTRQMAKARCLVMLYTGLRISDTVQLKRRSVRLDTGAVLLRVMKTGVPLYVRLGQPAIDALKTLPVESEYFFWSGKSKLRTCVGNARKSIQRVLKLAGVKGHPHRFRDTFSVALLGKGEDLRTVQLLLGHTSIKTTEKHYAPFVRSFQRILDAATAKLDFGVEPKRPVQNPVQNLKVARNA